MAGLLLGYRFSGGQLLPIATRIAQLIEPRVAAELAAEANAAQERQAIQADRQMREQFPFGLNTDGTRDVYCAPGFDEDLTT